MTITAEPSRKSAFEELFGSAEPIHVYTVQDAISDGTLVQIDEDLTKQYGFRWPVVMTKAAWTDAVEWTRDNASQDEDGRAWDVLTILRLFVPRLADGPQTTHVMRIANTTPSGAPSKAMHPSACMLTFSAAAMNPAGDPCLMVTLPGED